MNIDEAKAIPLPEILRKMGHLPVSKKENKRELAYFSPFRAENSPSFFVNTEKNLWIDFGMIGAGGKPVGGDGIKLVQLYLKKEGQDCTVSDALRWIGNMTKLPFKLPEAIAILPEETEATLIIREIKKIEERKLVEYIEGRGIPIAKARKYLKEAIVFNTKKGTTFHVLCMANEEEGHELRNDFFKGCIGTKSITFVRAANAPASEIHLFEGMFDMLSAIVVEGKKLQGDIICLNSVANLRTAFSYIENYTYKKLNTWLDNDDAGELATKTVKEFAAEQDNLKVVERNEAYKPHKDVNAWHVHKLKV